MDATQTQTSTTLLEQVALGDNQPACKEFYARYGRLVRALATAAGLGREDVEDVVQEVMIAAVEALRQHRYDRTRGRFKAWFKSVVYHKIGHARQFKNRNPKTKMEDVTDPHPGPPEQLEAAFEAEWQKVAYEAALDEIRREVDPATFQAFDLLVNKQQRPGDVAKLLGLSRNAVYIAKTRVLARLREKLSNSEHE